MRSKVQVCRMDGVEYVVATFRMCMEALKFPTLPVTRIIM
jgi:hypothetical protein